MKLRKIIFFWSTWALFIMLTACGFHLVGDTEFPKQFNQVYVESELTYSPLVSQLNRTLSSAGVTLANSADTAETILVITKDEQSAQKTGSATSQQTRTYHLAYQASFKLMSPTGANIYGPISVSSATTLYVYANQVFGNNQETTAIYQSLRRDVVQKIMIKLSSTQAHTALRSLPSSEKPTDDQTQTG